MNEYGELSRRIFESSKREQHCRAMVSTRATLAYNAHRAGNEQCVNTWDGERGPQPHILLEAFE